MPEPEECQDKPQENFPGCFVSPFMKRLKSFDDYEPSKAAIDAAASGITREMLRDASKATKPK